MATAALPLRRTLLSRLRKEAGRAAGRLLTPAKPVLTNLASIPFTLAGFGCIDFAAFHLAHGWGWLVTGGSLMLLEHMIADEQ